MNVDGILYFAPKFLNVRRVFVIFLGGSTWIQYIHEKNKIFISFVWIAQIDNPLTRSITNAGKIEYKPKATRHRSANYKQTSKLLSYLFFPKRMKTVQQMYSGHTSPSCLQLRFYITPASPRRLGINKNHREN